MQCCYVSKTNELRRSTAMRHVCTAVQYYIVAKHITVFGRQYKVADWWNGLILCLSLDC